MVESLYSEFKKFSQENWWVYVILLLCLFIIYITNTGNVIEIFFVFLVYVAADVCIMNMVRLREEKNYKIAALFQLLGVTVFNLLFTYHFYETGQLQYLIGSIGFVLATIKNICRYYLNFFLSFINGTTVFITNILVFTISYSILGELTLQIFFQACGWIFFSSSLVASNKHRKLRYFSGFIGLISMVIGAAIGIYVEFYSGTIYGVTICYFLLPLSVFLIYIKTLRNYL